MTPPPTSPAFSFRRSCATAIALACLLPYGSALVASPNTIVIGDSGSEEYAVEIFFSAPENPGGHQAKNWVELLAENRGTEFDFGRYKPAFGSSLWTDLRTWGYEGNFSFPGHRSDDGVDFIRAADVTDALGRQSLDGLLAADVQKAVVFLGANDMRDSYDDLYEGRSGARSKFVEETLASLQEIVAYLQSKKSSLQIVIVNVPDVGATPDEQQDHPDLSKRARATAAAVELNQRIATLAQNVGAGVADVFTISDDVARNGGYNLSGTQLIAQGHPDNDTRYLFARDNFHPNTGAQALYARAILQAFNARFGAGIPPLTDSDIAVILGLSLNQSSPFPGSEDLGGGWRRLNGFGDFYANNSPWIYHTDLGWVWASGEDGSDLWLWSQQQGFLWTSQDTYPYYYRLETGSFYLVDIAGGGDFIYDFAGNQWENNRLR